MQWPKKIETKELLQLVHEGEIDLTHYQLDELDIEPLQRYIDFGKLPGLFFQAIIKNDLGGACEHSDVRSRRRIFEFINFLKEVAPPESIGSPSHMYSWVTFGGRFGRPASLGK